MKDLEKEFKPSSWAIDNKTAVYVDRSSDHSIRVGELLQTAKGKFS